jgi:uncharacterized protein YdhG (YjbR/CyaY superfamily)
LVLDEIKAPALRGFLFCMYFVVMGKMQDVDFGSMEEFLAFLPEDELKIVELLRQIIFSCMPDVAEKLTYNIPYYKRHKNICFIWPSSVLWGKTKTYTGVRLGFINGHLLTDEIGYLDRTGRKYIGTRDFTDTKQIDAELLRSYIYEAILIDEDISARKKSREREP